jgi:hypothetical protein
VRQSARRLARLKQRSRPRKTGKRRRRAGGQRLLRAKDKRRAQRDPASRYDIETARKGLLARLVPELALRDLRPDPAPAALSASRLASGKRQPPDTARRLSRRKANQVRRFANRR